MDQLISKKIRGFRDILPEESKKFLFIENKIRDVCILFNTNHVKIPSLESINLFKRSIGETSDIVTKEMYSFKDRNDDELCLTPEGTASCMRLAFENNLIYDRGIKKNRLYYYAPMFRHERPQKGRYRQFIQFGVEFMGDNTIHNDIDIISMSREFFNRIKLTDLSLHINTLGSVSDREKYSEVLQDYFNSYKKDLSEKHEKTIQKNPIRLLDSKDDKLKDIIESAPVIYDYININSKKRHEEILNSLTNIGIKFINNSKLVRGLDYYNDLVFEWKTNKLGSQDAICAGGRYDILSKIIGGKEIPAVGFAMGVDRIVELLDYEDEELVVGIAVLSDSSEDLLKYSSILRNSKTIFRLIQMDNNKSLSKQIKNAVKNNCDILVIVGEDEIRNNTLTIKYLKSNQDDKTINLDNFTNFISERIDE